MGAKVNGSIVPLSYQLQMGDRVEILTQKSATPSRDWLNIVKTPSARSKIRSYFSKMSRSDDLQTGRDKLVHEMRKHGLGISSAQSMRAMKQVAEQYVQGLFQKLRDYEYNEDLMNLYVMGGGAKMVEIFGKYNPDRTTYNHDICANAKGYEYFCYMMLRQKNRSRWLDGYKESQFPLQ